METVAADDVERIGVVVDIPLVLFQEACLVVGIEGQVLARVHAVADGRQEDASR